MLVFGLKRTFKTRQPEARNYLVMTKQGVVLIVDDEATSRDSLEAILAEEGYRLVFATNGREALEQAFSLMPDLILLDVVMPGMDGYEVCRTLRADPNLAEVPIVLITILEDRSSRLLGIEAGADDFITKPFDSAELLARVHSIIRLNRYRRLLLERSRFEQIFHLSPDGIVIVDSSEKICMANPAILRMLNADNKNTIVGKFMTDFIAPDWQEEFSAFIEQVITGSPHVTQAELCLNCRKGLVIPVELNAGCHNWDDKPVAHIIIRDISERKKAEEDRLRLEAAVEQTAEAIIITDRNGKIQYINPAFSIFYGFQRDEVLSQDVETLIADSVSETRIFKLQSAEVAPWTGRLNCRMKDGNTFITDTTVSPINNKAGSVINYVLVQKDITKEISLEKQLRQAQKLEAIGTLASGIAHDFNNILGAIIGYTELAVRFSQEDKVRDYLEHVLLAGKRATDLVQQILTFSRQREQMRKPVQICLVIREVLKLLRSSLPTTIEIRQNLQSMNSHVRSDPTQIHQVMMNLCTNASHAMREHGGLLEVSLTDIELDQEYTFDNGANKPGPYVQLTVRDTGPGMPKALIDRIFEPYFTTKKPGEGTGLGLAMVHGIIKDMGGHITVESEPGKGSQFDLFMPRSDTESTDKPESLAHLPGGNESIFFIDDEEVLVDIGKQMLEMLGYHVVTATSSTQALDTFRSDCDQFDLVITDQTMPRMTGTELSTMLLSIKPDIPIILCTGFSETVSAEKAKSLGIREFIMKPLIIDKLALTIRKALEI